MGLDPGVEVELATAAVMCVGLGRILYYVISRDRENAIYYGEPPARSSFWMRLRLAFNPGRLYRWSWTPVPATIKRVFLIREDTSATVASFPGYGFRIKHPWKTARRYGIGVRYQYSAGSQSFWGEYRSIRFYRTQREAQERAGALLEIEIPIRYDPRFPEDSRPVLENSPLPR